MKKGKAESKPNVKFSEIRALEGKQDKGFEELCVQLLPILIGEAVQRMDRIDGRGGDGGVEAIALTVSGQYVGLQSKFITQLETSQWRQVDSSVRTAVEKHPELTRYIVCAPLDRTPAQLKKWAVHVTQWRTLNPNLSVEWAGYSELLNCLQSADASHILTYWFSFPEFSTEWIFRQTQVAIGQLHNRYTPKLHQKTSTELQLAFLTGSEKACTTHRQTCSKLVIAWRELMEGLPRELKKLKRPVSIETLVQAHKKILSSIKNGNLNEQDEELITALVDAENKVKNLVEHLFPRGGVGDFDWEKLREFRRESNLDITIDLTTEVLDQIRRFAVAQNQQIWVLTGQAGSGKSHLMANLAGVVLAEKRSCLLLVGERFASTDVPASQIPELLGWSGSMRELLACMSAEAVITGKAALLMIDAINESPLRGYWLRELPQFVALVKEFRNVRLLISCRTDCLDSSIQSSIFDAAAYVNHRGFDLQFHAAVTAYFNGYKVTSAQFPTLSTEFQNPLFLKTLCEAYRGRALPLGSVSFVGVLAAWEVRIGEEIEKRIDCPRDATGRAVNEIVKALAHSDARRLDAEQVRSICLKHFPLPTASNSLYRHLNSEGLLQEIQTKDGLQVRLQYERFSDVRVAQIALQNVSTKSDLLVHWHTNLLPKFIEAGQLDLMAAPALFAYALILPDHCGVELIQCPIATLIHEDWARTRAKDMMWTAWLDALSWRVFLPSDFQVIRHFRTWAKTGRLRDIWERLIEFSCIPNHSLNADFLHRHLIQLSLPERESSWTISLALESLTDQSESIVAPFLYWADASKGQSSDEQVRLTAIVLLWFTSSPNRELRDKATDIAIRVLAAKRGGEICIWLLENFWEVNDPYVKERLLAVVCGVLPHLQSAESKQISEFVLNHFWLKSDVSPHILQRDYAEFILQFTCETGILPAANLKLLLRKVNNAKPNVWTEDQVKHFEADPRYRRIASSLRPEEMGNYGDFGRYVMGSFVHQFVDDDQAEGKTMGFYTRRKNHDARFARRYIWQRVVELGWTPERYSDFESSLVDSGRGREENKLERFSKKYQWIGLHEYLGLLADSLLFRPWNDVDRPLRGAWELSVRDYDPSHAVGVSDLVSADEDIPPTWWNAASPIVSKNTIEEKQQWVSANFCAFEPYLTFAYDHKQWLVLNAHLNFNEGLGFGVEQFKSAQMSQWIDVRAFLIPKSDLANKLKALQGEDFFGDRCDIPQAHQCWISEYPWHSIFAELDENCLTNETWLRELKQQFFLPSCEISKDSKHVQLPAPTLYRGLEEVMGASLSAPILSPNGAMEIYSKDESCIFMGSTQGGRVLVVDLVVMQRYLAKKDFAVVWAVLSEKSAWDGSHHVGGLSLQSAVYILSEDGTIKGGHTVKKISPAENRSH